MIYLLNLCCVGSQSETHLSSLIIHDWRTSSYWSQYHYGLSERFTCFCWHSNSGDDITCSVEGTSSSEGWAASAATLTETHHFLCHVFSTDLIRFRTRIAKERTRMFQTCSRQLIFLTPRNGTSRKVGHCQYVIFQVFDDTSPAHALRERISFFWH